MTQAAEKIADYSVETPVRQVRLFRNGANQAVRIPKEFELPGKEAVMRREGNRLIIEAVTPKPASLADAMKDWENDDEPFPDVDEGLLPLDDINHERGDTF